MATQETISIQVMLNGLKFVMAIIVAYIGYRLGLAAYFRQREYETVRTRYLDEGIDLFSENAAHILGVFRHNFSIALRSLRNFREMGGDYSEGNIAIDFVEPDQSKFGAIAGRRIKELTNSDVFLNLHGSLLAEVCSANFFLKGELIETLRKAIRNGDHTDDSKRMNLYVRSEKFLKELDKKVSRYHAIINGLQVIGRTLQTEKFTFKGIQHYHQKKEIQEVIKVLETEFADEL